MGITAVAKGNHKEGVVQGQTRQHALLLKLLGIKQLIVCVNKMDEKQAGYKEERFNEIKTEMQRMLVQVGWTKDEVQKQIPVIPISGWKGIIYSTNLKLWDGGKVLTLRSEIRPYTSTLFMMLLMIWLLFQRDQLMLHSECLFLKT